MSDGEAPQPHRVLIVDDAPEMVKVIEATIRDGHYELMTAMNGPDAVEAGRTFDPDVVILDVDLPGIDGFEVCRQLRGFTDAYIIMLTGHSDEVDRLVGLSVGADDYMTKPFSIRELALRVRVLLRRPRESMRSQPTADDDQGKDSGLTVGSLSIDLPAREVWRGDEVISLTKIEFDLLAALAQRPDMVFSRRLLVQTVWGDDWIGDDHMVSVHIANLRKKVDDGDVSHIRTVRGVGYRINPDLD